MYVSYFAITTSSSLVKYKSFKQFVDKLFFLMCVGKPMYIMLNPFAFMARQTQNVTLTITAAAAAAIATCHKINRNYLTTMAVLTLTMYH